MEIHEKKGKQKIVSQYMNAGMIRVALGKKEKNDGWIQQLRNAYHCLDTQYSDNDTLHGNYCKTRFCLLCSNIRKADIINRYWPVLSTWKNPQFVTLTSKAVPKKQLKKKMKDTKATLQRIIAKYRKRHQRGKHFPLLGIYSLECNFNPKRGTYNPHLHLIVPDRETAELLRDEWLAEWGFPIVRKESQCIIEVKNMQRMLIEVVKYSSKIFTEPDPANKNPKKPVKRSLYVRAMRGMRIFDRFGFDLSKKNRERKVKPLVYYDAWVYDPKALDWVNPDMGETLTDFEPPEELSLMLKYVKTEAE